MGLTPFFPLGRQPLPGYPYGLLFSLDRCLLYDYQVLQSNISETTEAAGHDICPSWRNLVEKVTAN